MKKRETIRNLVPLLRLYKWGFPAIIVLGLLQSLSEGIGIGLFIPLLNGLTTGARPRANGHRLVDTMERLFQSVAPDRRLAVIVMCVFAAVLASALLGYLHYILFGWIDGNIA